MEWCTNWFGAHSYLCVACMWHKLSAIWGQPCVRTPHRTRTLHAALAMQGFHMLLHAALSHENPQPIMGYSHPSQTQHQFDSTYLATLPWLTLILRILCINLLLLLSCRLENAAAQLGRHELNRQIAIRVTSEWCGWERQKQSGNAKAECGTRRQPSARLTSSSSWLRFRFSVRGRV